jgi:pSer/pThr/pTyr-binding forkhead associated (FHA) protein
VSTGSQSRHASLAERCFLEQLSGKGKGRVFELVRDKLTLGRQEENDIVAQAEGVSRQHAMFIRSEGNWFIRDNQSRNGILVNGKQVKEAWLKTGDVIQLGGFVVRFNGGTGLHEQSAARSLAQTEDVGALAPVGGGVSKPARKGINKRLLIYGIGGLVLAGVLMMSSGGDDSKKAPAGDGQGQTGQADGTAPAGGKLASDFKVAEEPKLVGQRPPDQLPGLEDPVLKRAEQEMAKLDWTNSSLRESEQFFRRGQREYLERNYDRAIEYFQTALSLYRGHVLADEYLRRTLYEAESAAKLHMQLGVQYFESLQYQRAIYHFTQVVNLMAHRPNEPIIGEAEKYIQQSKRRLQAAELFP